MSLAAGDIAPGVLDSGDPGQDEQRCLPILLKRLNVGVPQPEDRLDIGRPAVPEMDPDHLRRRPAQKTPLAIVVVLRDDRVARRGCVLLDRFVVGRLEAEVTHVRRVRVEIGESTDEARREVLVE